MDLYCIATGKLLDNPSVRTLEHPEKHSVHWYVVAIHEANDFGCLGDENLLTISFFCYLSACFYDSLVDVDRCVAGPFELLLDPEDGGLYRRGYRLTLAGQSTLTNLARSVGICDTCQGGGYYKQGFRVAVNGTIVELASGDVPPVLSVDSVQAVSAASCFSIVLWNVVALGTVWVLLLF